MSQPKYRATFSQRAAARLRRLHWGIEMNIGQMFNHYANMVPEEKPIPVKRPRKGGDAKAGAFEVRQAMFGKGMMTGKALAEKLGVTQAHGNWLMRHHVERKNVAQVDSTFGHKNGKPMLYYDWVAP